MKKFALLLCVICFGHNLPGQTTVLEAFSEFEIQENNRQVFIKEIIELDSILKFKNYQEIIKKNYKPKQLTIEFKDGVIHLDFSSIFCPDISKLIDEDRLPNFLKFRTKNKLKTFCKVLASDIDIFPKRTGDMKTDAKIYLSTIKDLIDKNKDILDPFTYNDFLKLEASKHITSDSEKFIFRKDFLKFLNDKYHISNNE